MARRIVRDEPSDFVPGPVGSRRPPEAASRRIFGFRLSRLSADEIAEQIASPEARDHTRCRYIVTPNLDHIVRLRESSAFRAAYRDADIIAPDGFPIVTYARLRGEPVARRVTGHDILQAAVSRLSDSEARLYFLVNTAETAAGLRRWADANWHRGAERLRSRVPPQGFEHDAAYVQDLIADIRRHNTNLLVLGIGAPKSEIFLHTHRRALPGLWAMAVGDSVSALAGTAVRAPAWTQAANLEWLYRVASDPRRLARRYFWDSRKFVLAVLDDFRQRWPD